MHKQIIDNQFGFQKEQSIVDCIFLRESIKTKTLASRNDYTVHVSMLRSALTNQKETSYFKKMFKVILYSYLILKKMNERITDS